MEWRQNAWKFIFLNDVLRDQMGFKGLVVGDWNGHGQLPSCTNKSCPEAFNAGVDIFMVPQDWKELYKNTLMMFKMALFQPQDLIKQLRGSYKLNIISVCYQVKSITNFQKIL